MEGEPHEIIICFLLSFLQNKLRFYRSIKERSSNYWPRWQQQASPIKKANFRNINIVLLVVSLQVIPNYIISGSTETPALTPFHHSELLHLRQSFHLTKLEYVGKCNYCRSNPCLFKAGNALSGAERQHRGLGGPTSNARQVKLLLYNCELI